MMTVTELVAALDKGAVAFKDVISVIEQNYSFTPTAFKNGEWHNAAGDNNGSCKIFAFAQLNRLSESATLNAFGDFYTQDVLLHPQGDDHQNIRNFMRFGWQGVEFSGEALKPVH